MATDCLRIRPCDVLRTSGTGRAGRDPSDTPITRRSIVHVPSDIRPRRRGRHRRGQRHDPGRVQRWWGWRWWRQQPERRGHRHHRAELRRRPRWLRPAAVLEGRSSSSSRALYDSLFVTQPDGTVEPSLVTEFENNADNTQTTLTLRDDVTFTDGSTLDAELVKANLDRRATSRSRPTAPSPPGQAVGDHRRDGAGRADRRHHLGGAADDAGEQPRRHRRGHRRRGRRRRPRLAGDHPRRLRRLHAQRGRDDPGQQLHPGQERRGVERRRVDVRHHRLQRHHRPAGAGQRGRLRSGRRRHHPRPDHHRAGRVAAGHGQRRRDDRRLLHVRQDGRDEPGVRQRGGPAGDRLRHRPRGAGERPAPRLPAHGAAVPRGRRRLRPGDRRGVRLRPRPGS